MKNMILVTINFILSVVVGVLVFVDFFCNVFKVNFFESNKVLATYILIMCVYGVYNFIINYLISLKENIFR